MALYAIGDLHLSLGTDKPMDVFGGGWEGYMDKLRDNLSILTEDDWIVLCGDTSWGMNLEEAREDFRFLNEMPGKKLLLKGNHDYWWTTTAKMKRFFSENGFHKLDFLHNNCHFFGETALCGTRGWFFEEDAEPADEKVFRRELLRLETSLKAASDHEKICFLHYPPLYQGYTCPEILSLLERYHVKSCYYGHLHGKSHRLALEGERNGIRFSLIAADYLHFIPEIIL